MPTEAEEPKVRERPGCVLGIALGLLILGSIVAWIILPKGEARDGAVLFAQWFGPSALPAEFEIDDAGKLMGGEEVLKLVRSSAAAERGLVPPDKTAKPAEEARVDWARVEQGAPDQLPQSLIIVRYPKERTQRELNRLFSEKLETGRLETIGNRGGRMVLEFGTLPWGDRFSAFVVEREFEAGGTFRDVVRLNLSKPDDALVVNARWSRSEPFSKRRLESLLASLQRP